MKLPWKNSLYARSALFLALGTAALAGAIVVLSQVMVDKTVTRLLDERVDLAATAGALIEMSIQDDLGRLAHRVRDPLQAEDPMGVRAALDLEYRTTMFSGDAFALDSQGHILANVPGAAPDLGAIDLADLRDRAAWDAASTNLAHFPPSNRPALVILAPVRSRSEQLLGYVGGLLEPASDNLLRVLAETISMRRAQFDLLDRNGVVVASTDPTGLYTITDHDNLLADALKSGQVVRGRCHSCHIEDDRTHRQTEVLAFTPLPHLGLGLAVREPEKAALAPAFAIRSQLAKVSVAFLALFLLSALLSVRSIVQPINRLTRCLQTLKLPRGHCDLDRFGHDEIGQLAVAMNTWREQVRDSMADAERHRLALHAEMEATREHLEILQEIVVNGSFGRSLDDILQFGLAKALKLSGMPAGVLRTTDGTRDVLAWHGLPEQHARELIEHCRTMSETDEEYGSDLQEVRFFDFSSRVDELPRDDLRTIVYGRQAGPHGFRICCLVGAPEPGHEVRMRRLQSLLGHIGLTAANRMLRDQEQAQEAVRHAYLHRIMKAQEDERRRVARELHDTLAQDLAALRLQAEVAASHVSDPTAREQIRELEERTHEMLVLVRSILLDLRLPVLEDIGFIGTVRWQLDRIGKPNHVRTVLTIDGDERPIPYALAVPLFRIVQESIQNAINHGDAHHIFVGVEFLPDAIQVTIEDDGDGFDVEAVRAVRPGQEGGRGLGLQGIDERASLLDGQVTITSAPGEGTTVSVTAPMG